MGSSSQVLTQTIQDAVLKLCTQQLSFCKSLEIDGIICISQGEDIAKDIIVKMHRTVFKSAESQPLGYEIDGGSHYEPSQTFSLLEDGVICEEPPRDITPLSSFNTNPKKLQGKKTRKRSLDDETASSSKQHKKLDSVVIKIETEDSITLDSADVGDNEDNYDDSSNWANEEDTSEYKDTPKDKTVSTKDPDDGMDIVESICSIILKSDGSFKSRLYTCGRCSKNFQMKSLMKNHIKEFHAKAILEDTHDAVDNASPNAPTDRAIPVPSDVITSSPGGHRCMECHRCFKYEKHLKRHELVHTGERPYKCVHCNKDFRRVDTLMKHSLIHTARKDSNANEGKVLVKTPCESQMSVQGTTEEVKKVCAECGKEFTKMRQLNKHMKTAHSDERPYQCDACPKAFKQQDKLKDHVNRIHKKITKCIQCEFCAELFSSNAALRKHTLTRHDPNYQRPEFMCDQCPKKFLIKNHLEYHVKATHTGELNLVCPNCDRRFTRSLHLKRHMLTHNTGPKPFSCPQCDSTFSRKEHMKRHLIKSCRGTSKHVVIFETPAVTQDHVEEERQRELELSTLALLNMPKSPQQADLFTGQQNNI